jgi:ribonuclease HII
LNILKATLIAMEHAVENLLSKITAQPRILLLIDGNMGIDVKLDTECIIDGDCKSKSIAAASILAKVTRDRMMRIYDKAYPQYGFSAHKGYGTPEHISNIKKYGLSQIHRLKFCDDFLPEGNLESDAGLI